VPVFPVRDALRVRPAWLLSVLTLVFMSGMVPGVGQPAPSDSPAATREPAPPAPPGAPNRPRSGRFFQERIDAAVRALKELPQFKDVSPAYLQGLAEFVSGNMLFVLLHQLGLAAITEMGLPVVGKIEDAADSFAALRLIRVGTDFSTRVLTEAAKGWFLAARRDQKTGRKVAYYDRHGLNQQRAYQIVCLMVGADDEKFRDLANETELPEERQESCAGDYSNAAYSWDLVLKPHLSPPGQPKVEVDALYGPAEGRAAIARQMANSMRLLQVVTERVANEYMWPVPFTLEMQSCGAPDARWDLATHKLTLCYELSAEFADLYRDYGARAERPKIAENAKRQTAAVPRYKPSSTPTRRKRKSGR
jgi:hypothetical protein